MRKANSKAILYALAGIGIGAAGTSAALHAQGARTSLAYFVGEAEIHDQAAFKSFVAQAPATFAPYGGRYLVRNSHTTEILEGAPPANTIVIIEFPSMKEAKAWYNSPDYGKIKPTRLASAKTRAFIVEDPPPSAPRP